MISIRSGGRRPQVLIAVAAAAALGLAACSSGSGGGGGQAVSQGGINGLDDGTTLTLWTRAPLEIQANLLVKAYNSTHKNQVKLTIVPNDDYVTKVGAAAGSPPRRAGTRAGLRRAPSPRTLTRSRMRRRSRR